VGRECAAKDVKLTGSGVQIDCYRLLAVNTLGPPDGIILDLDKLGQRVTSFCRQLQSLLHKYLSFSPAIVKAACAKDSDHAVLTLGHFSYLISHNQVVTAYLK
jgi:hypothetical protein